MAKKSKRTRVVIYLDEIRTKNAERKRRDGCYKNINRYISDHINDWLLK